MIDKNKFRAIVVENGMTMKEVAVCIGVNVATLYRKVNGESDFTREELQKMRERMGLSDDQVINIFFAE